MATSTTSVASAGRRGALAMLPMLAGYVPFALVIGSAAADRGTPLAGWAGSWLILGGSAHLATMRTLDEAGLAAAIFTGLLINARLLVYSASLARRWGEQPRWFRFAAAGLIIDPTWVVADRHAEQATDLAEHRGYFLGAGLTLAAGWSGAMAVGAVLGARLDWLDLQIAVPLCLLALVGPGLRARGTRLVIVVAGAVALLTASWPSGTGLLAAIAAGCITALAIDRRAPA
jgi:predicted branched-subunit amino acid permease